MTFVISLLVVAVSPPSPLHELLIGVFDFSLGFLISVLSICLIRALPMYVLFVLFLVTNGIVFLVIVPAFLPAFPLR